MIFEFVITWWCFIIPNTSKTEVETRNVLESLDLKTPLIVENGVKSCEVYISIQLIGETDKEFGIEAFELNDIPETLRESFLWVIFSQ